MSWNADQAPHHYHRLVAQGPRDAVTFLIVMHRLVALMVIHDAIVEQQIVVVRRMQLNIAQ
jgi:hypothetical protein